MSILKKIFGINTKEPVTDKTDLKIDKSELSGLEKFKSKKSDRRMKDIMMLGDTGNSNAFEILEYAVLYDNDSGVVMAGLKRLSNFKNDKRLPTLLEKLKNKADIKKYEPYYSMTLLNLGLIDENEFNQIFEE